MLSDLRCEAVSAISTRKFASCTIVPEVGSVAVRCGMLCAGAFCVCRITAKTLPCLLARLHPSSRQSQIDVFAPPALPLREIEERIVKHVDRDSGGGGTGAIGANGDAVGVNGDGHGINNDGVGQGIGGSGVGDDGGELRLQAKERKMMCREVVLGPGDVLYIPPYWMHVVETLPTLQRPNDHDHDRGERRGAGGIRPLPLLSPDGARYSYDPPSVSVSANTGSEAMEVVAALKQVAPPVHTSHTTTSQRIASVTDTMPLTRRPLTIASMLLYIAGTFGSADFNFYFVNGSFPPLVKTNLCFLFTCDNNNDCRVG